MILLELPTLILIDLSDFNIIMKPIISNEIAAALKIVCNTSVINWQ